MAPVTLSGMEATGLLAPELSGEIFRRVREESAVLRVAGSAPMSITGNEYVIRTVEPEADIVAEAAPKPISDIGLATKTVAPVKAATIVYWSKEARMKNPGGVFSDIQDAMTKAIHRQIDQAILHGKSAKSGATIPGVEYINQTTNRVALGTSAITAGGLTADFLAGYDTVVNADYDFTGFVADPRLRSQVIGAVDVNGRPVYQTSGTDLTAPVSNFLGLPMTYSKATSGKIGATPDQGTRAFGGDFAGNLKVGFVDQISFRKTDQATLVDGGQTVSLWQNNMEAALVEAIFGWVIRDTAAFAAYDAEAAEG